MELAWRFKFQMRPRFTRSLRKLSMGKKFEKLQYKVGERCLSKQTLLEILRLRFKNSKVLELCRLTWTVSWERLVSSITIKVCLLKPWKFGNKVIVLLSCFECCYLLVLSKICIYWYQCFKEAGTEQAVPTSQIFFSALSISQNPSLQIITVSGHFDFTGEEEATSCFSGNT